MTAACSFEMSRYDYPVTQHHIQKSGYLSYFNAKTSKLGVFVMSCEH
jgi:hypothetical protein